MRRRSLKIIAAKKRISGVGYCGEAGLLSICSHPLSVPGLGLFAMSISLKPSRPSLLDEKIGGTKPRSLVMYPMLGRWLA